MTRRAKNKLPRAPERAHDSLSDAISLTDNLVLIVDKKDYRSKMLKSIREKAETLPEGPI